MKQIMLTKVKESFPMVEKTLTVGRNVEADETLPQRLCDCSLRLLSYQKQDKELKL